MAIEEKIVSFEKLSRYDQQIKAYIDHELSQIETGTDTNDATATADKVFLDETFYAGGQKRTGTFTIESEVNSQNELIASIKTALEGKTAGSGGDTLKTFFDSTKSTCFLFYNSPITTAEGLIPYNATENVTNMSAMFRGCTKLTKAPLYNTSNVTNMNSMFYGCRALTEVPSFDTSNVKNIGSMFYGCTSLIVAPALNTKNVTDMSSMFRNCSKLKSVKFVRCDSATSFSYCFDGCSSLELVDFRGASHYPNMSSTTSFRDVPSSCKVVIPDHLYSKWTNATNWSALDVIYVKESEYSIEQGETISFTIDGVTYQATKDMIWLDWANSDFDTARFYCDTEFGYVSLSGATVYHNETIVTGRDIIIENGEYQTK